MKYDFIGKPYIKDTEEATEKARKEILAQYDKYQIKKLQFLNECYTSEKTRASYWALYMNNIYYDEVNKGKDLIKFTTNELKILISSSFGMDTTKASIGSLLSMYYRWGEKRGEVIVNPFLEVKTSLIKANSKRLLESKLYGQQAFYDLCDDMQEHTRIPNIIPLVLARYGIIGEKLYHMRHLRWSDIDQDKMIVNIKDENGEKLSELPIDSNFLFWIKKAKDYTETTEKELRQDGEDISKKRLIQYADYGYVLKKALDLKEDKTEEDKVNKYNTIYNRIQVACTSVGIKRIACKDLVRTRQIELLLQIRKNRRLNMQDFEDIVKLFALEHTPRLDNRTYTLKKRYEELTGDTVEIPKKNIILEPDNNSEEFANKLIDEFGLELL